MKAFKIVISVILVLVVIVIGAAVIVPKLVNLDQYKQKAIDIVAQKSGYQLSIEGDMQLSLFPEVSIVIENVSLFNPELIQQLGHKVASVSQAQIAVKVWPLLKKQIEVNTIDVDGLNLNLVRNEQGDSNWIINTEPSETTAPKESADLQQIATSIDGVVIKKISIKNSQLKYSDDQQSISLDGFNFNANNVMTNELFKMDLSAEITGTSLTQALKLSINNQMMVDTQAAQIRVSDIVMMADYGDIQVENQIAQLDVSLASQLNVLSKGLSSSVIVNEQPLQLSLDQIEFSAQANTLNVEQLKLVSKTDKLDATIESGKINYDLNNKVVSYDLLAISAAQKNRSIVINLPKNNVDLNQGEFSLEKINGQFSEEDLDGTIEIERLVVNKNSNTYELNSFQLKSDHSQINASVNGQWGATKKANATLSLDSSELRKILSLFDISLNQINSEKLKSAQLLASLDWSNNQLKAVLSDGVLDDVTFNIQLDADLESKATMIDATVGRVDIDEYLLSQTSKTSQVNQANDATAIKQFQLPILDLNANLVFKGIHSDQKNIDISDVVMKISSKADSKFTIDVAADVRQVLQGLALKTKLITTVDGSAQPISFNDTLITSKAGNQGVELKLPKILMPDGVNDLKITQLSINAQKDKQRLSVLVPNSVFSFKEKYLIVSNMSAQGQIMGIDVEASLPQLNYLLKSNKIDAKEISIDLKDKQPIGHISMPHLGYQINTHQIDALDARLESGDGVVNLTMPSGRLAEDAELEGVFKAQNYNLKGLLVRFNAYPFDADSSGLTNTNLETTFAVNSRHFAIRNIVANVDGANITGSLDVNYENKPDIIFDLNLDRFNRELYSSKQENINAQSSNDNDIPFSVLMAFDAKGQLKVNHLILSEKVAMNNLLMSVDLKNGIMNAPLNAKFIGGELKINAQVDAPKEKITINNTLSALDLGVALPALGVTDKFTGHGDLSMDITANGSSQSALLDNSNGVIKVEIKDGDLKGVDVQNLLYQAYSAFKTLKNKPINQKYSPDKSTQFSSMNGQWALRNGVLYGDDLQITAPAFRISGKGQVSMIKEHVDYSLAINVVDSFNGQGGKDLSQLKGHTIPFKVSGPFKNISYGLDISDLIKAQLEQQINKQKDKVKSKLLEKLDEKLNNNQQKNSGGADQAPSDPGQSLEEQLKERVQEKLKDQLFNLFN